MRRFFRNLARIVLLVLVSAATFAMFWFGMVPQRWSPFTPLQLDRPDQWFIDAKLAALRHDPPLCQATLKAPLIRAASIPDIPIVDGCGAENSVRLYGAAGAKLHAQRVSCEVAAALALWLNHDVQQAAVAILGQRVESVSQMGTYSCRNIIGSNVWRGVRSQHATANAIDIGGFTLEGGRQISLVKGWDGAADEARFLRTIHQSACRYFRVALGPDFNSAHKDHFHFDRGPMWTCK